MPMCVETAAKSLDRCWSLKEPERSGCLAALVNSTSFQAFFTIVILLNTVYMVWSTDLDVRDPQQHLATRVTIDRVFLVLYSVELTSKLIAHRLYYFWNEDAAWNWMDFVLVMLSLVDMSFTSSDQGNNHGAMWVRMIRLFRLSKVARLLRVFKMFSELRLIMTAILQSTAAFTSSAVVIVLICLMFALYFVSSVGAFLQVQEEGSDDSSGLVENYGTVSTSMYTLLFQTMLGGADWVEFYDVLKPIGGASAAVFLVWVTFANIALLNIVTGMFVNSAMKIAEGDMLTKAENEMEEAKDYAQGLWNLMAQADTDKSNRLSEEEFAKLLDDGTLRSYLHYQGIDSTWVKEHLPVMWDELSKGEEDVDCNDIVERCMAFRTTARSAEIRGLRRELEDLTKHITRLLGSMQVHSSDTHAVANFSN